MRETLQIVTDSTSGIPHEILRKHKITVIPALITIGNNTYRDGIDITPNECLKMITNGSPAPKTAAPNLQAYEDAYSSHPDKSLAIFLGSNFSSICENGIIAARKFGPDRVTVFDSGSTSHALGYMAVKAAEWAEENTPLNIILNNLKNLAGRTRVLASLDTVRYAVLGGRLGKIGSLLELRPVIEIANNKINILDLKIRTRRKSLEKLLKRAVESTHLEFASIMHAGAEEIDLNIVRKGLETVFDGPTWFGIIGTALSAHAGPKAIALSLVRKG